MFPINRFKCHIFCLGPYSATSVLAGNRLSSLASKLWGFVEDIINKKVAFWGLETWYEVTWPYANTNRHYIDFCQLSKNVKFFQYAISWKRLKHKYRQLETKQWANKQSMCVPNMEPLSLTIKILEQHLNFWWRWASFSNQKEFLGYFYVPDFPVELVIGWCKNHVGMTCHLW